MTDKETAILLGKYEKIKGYSSERFDDEDWAEFDAFCKGYDLAQSEQTQPTSETLKAALNF